MSSDISLWSERQRLRFIERVLFWRGYINRRDLLDRFGISPPQATNDLVNYSTRNPRGCAYNVRKKCYQTAPDFRPILIEPDLGRDLTRMGAGVWPDDESSFLAEPETPRRVPKPDISRQLSLAAFTRESVEIRYWSVSAGTADWRRIGPRAFADDGLRWHVRAWCYQRREFRDFVITRIRGVRDRKNCEAKKEIDEAWNRWITMVIRPNPKLPENQRKALIIDYGMRKGHLRLPVREALLVYSARRLGFVKDPEGNQLPMLNELKQLEWTSTERYR